MTGSAVPSVLCHASPPTDAGVVAYDDPEGISRTAILALAQDERGYLWIGTERGPVRFDGMEWATPAGLAALHTFDTWAFDTLEPGALWVGANGAGLHRIDTRPVPYRPTLSLTDADGLADSDVHALCRDADRALWVGTHRGLAVLDSARVGACWTVQEGIPEAGICALCAGSPGQMWAGSLQGLLWLEGRMLRRRFTRADGLPDPAVYALCADAAGRVWAGTRGGIAILEDGRVGAVIAEGLPSLEVRALCRDRAGRMWAGTARGLAAIEDGRVLRCWTRAHGLPASSIWSVLCDDDDRIWVGTEGGLALLPRRSLPVRALAHGDDAEGAYTFAVDRRQQVWIGMASGLATVVSDTHIRSVTAAIPPILAQAGVWAIQHDDAGRRWVAGRYGGLFCLDPATGETLMHIDAVNAVRCMVDDAEGRLWLGTLGAGLACLDTGSGALLHRLTAAEGLPSDHASALCMDPRGRLWVGTQGGVACIDRRGLVERTFGSAEGLPHPAVSGLALGPGDRLWGTTQGGGLFRMDLASGRIDGVWTRVHGLPSEALLSCAVDAEGTLWLGTARGLVRYRPSTGEALILGRPHGLPGECCLQGALLLDGRERLWVGTTEGCAMVDVRAVPDTIPACAVFLTGIRIMGEERARVAGLEIEDSEYDLLIDYGAVTFVAAAQVHYRTQLVGLERDWSPPHPHRFARYTNLRPGDYTFRVAARNWGGQWSAPAEWRFRVVRNRQAEDLDQARQRAEAAEAAVRIRNETLATVAHDLRTPLTAISGHADLLQLRLGRAEPPSRDWLRSEAALLQEGARRMARMVEEILAAAQLPEREHLHLQIAPVDVGLLVRRVASARAPGTDCPPLEIDAPPDLIVEGDEARLERVVQNLLDNACKYSPEATPVSVSVYRQDDGVGIRVQDRGVGIPASELPHIFTPYFRASTSRGIPGSGIGLAGALTIVAQHGGRLLVESNTGSGTTATVYLPHRPPEA